METIVYPDVPRTVNTAKLYREAHAAGLPVISVNALGKAAFERELDAAESSLYQSLLQAHEPRDAAAEEKSALLAAGVTREAMLDALWQAVAEGDPSAVLALREKIADTKAAVRP